MDEIKETNEEVPTENLQVQLNAAKEEIQSLTQQLNCLLVLTKNAWRGDESATVHLARVIGIDSQVEPNAFVGKKVVTERATSAKKTVTIAENDDVIFHQAPSFASSTSQENLQEQRSTPTPAVTRDAYLQPFLKQSHIDPIRGQDSRRIFNNMVRHHQNEMRRPPIIVNRSSPSNVRPRATKHLYRPASAEQVVRHLGSPISRVKPYFVFAGKEFFQQTTNYSPLYQRAVVSAGGSRQSRHSDYSDESENATTSAAEPVIVRPQTARSAQQSSSSTLRFAAHPSLVNAPTRSSSALSNTSSSKLTQMSDQDRRSTMRLQRQLNLPRQGWLNQQS